MNMDAFSKRHPLVNFLFFVGAIGMGIMIQHPAYLAAGVLCAGTYYLLLKGRSGLAFLGAMVPLFLVLSAINPLFNTYGERVLFSFFGRPYTLEALLYGGANAAMFVAMLLWFGCYNVVLTSDKFTSLFGNLIPALSLLLVMVLRLIPNLMRKAAQLSGARRSIGRGAAEDAPVKEKLAEGMVVLSALTDWALEGSIVTGDSMRSRGYGTAKRSSFMIYRMTGLDRLLLALILILAAVVVGFALTGAVSAAYTPQLQIAPITGHRMLGYGAYWAYLLIPTVLHIKEAIQWHISRSKI